MTGDNGRHDAEFEAIGDGAANTRAHKTQLWKAVITQDQPVIDDGIQGHSANRNDRRPDRLFQCSNEIAQHEKADERQDRPHIEARENSGIGGYAGLLARQQQDAFGVPENNPHRDHDRDRGPKPLPERPPDIAHRMRHATLFRRHHRRGRGDQAHRKDRENHREIMPHSARRQLARAEPAQQDDIGHPDQHHRQVRQYHRPGKLDGRAKLIAPEGLAVHRDCHCGHGMGWI